ncbi:DUF1414 domain-containing protein [Paraferrimonas sp. SM1919]|uniref:DUF1414 domain-containing protein n=1 Tax=Paraferrimonas sp. SM1919 TaxID=2662263 RepID=UPI0013D54E4D|nr:DUF1414 domain-containing protein [Paraferrimonas sp. SM1919]
MAQISKYTNEQVEALVDDLLATLEKHQAPVDLSMMCLGNALSHLLNTRVNKETRVQLAEQIGQILISSTKS